MSAGKGTIAVGIIGAGIMGTKHARIYSELEHARLFGVAYIDGKKASATVLRPPGAVEEERFLAACTKCGLCVSACPSDAIQLVRKKERVPPPADEMEWYEQRARQRGVDISAFK
jgi:ferredoxin